MSSFLITIAVGLSSLFSNQLHAFDFSNTTPQQHYLTQIKLDHPISQLTWLREHGYDIAGVDLKDMTVDIVSDDNNSYHLTSQNWKMLDNVRITNDAPDARYQTPEKIDALLSQWQQRYPTLVKKIEIGKSLEGRSIWAAEITSPLNNPSNKKVVLFNAMHHAREIMTSEVAVDTGETLLSGYGRDAKITNYLDKLKVVVIPMFNVDGNHIVWTTDNMWRKNARDGFGVDINRNYPYAWGSCNGSSGYTGAQDYRGPSAASEPETNVMMNYVKKIKPVFNISYHSYSELVLYPYGCQGEHVPNHDVVKKIADEIAALLPSDDNDGSFYTSGTPWETLYAVDGGDIDWMYHDMNVIPFVIELNSRRLGFQPDYDTWRNKTVQKLRPAWMLLLDKTLLLSNGRGGGVRPFR
jgi:hypothetical protein